MICHPFLLVCLAANIHVAFGSGKISHISMPVPSLVDYKNKPKPYQSSTASRALILHWKGKSHNPNSQKIFPKSQSLHPMSWTWTTSSNTLNTTQLSSTTRPKPSTLSTRQIDIFLKKKSKSMENIQSTQDTTFDQLSTRL